MQLHQNQFVSTKSWGRTRKLLTSYLREVWYCEFFLSDIHFIVCCLISIEYRGLYRLHPGNGIKWPSQVLSSPFFFFVPGRMILEMHWNKMLLRSMRDPIRELKLYEERIVDKSGTAFMCQNLKLLWRAKGKTEVARTCSTFYASGSGLDQVIQREE